MKAKLIATVLLSVIGLLPVLGGTTHAQPLDNQQSLQQRTISNTVYLPLISKPPCTWVHPEAYIAVNRPIVKIGDWVTVTGVIISDCAIVGNPDGRLHTTPEGLLTPSNIIANPFGGSLNYGAYREFTFTVQAVQAGVVSITVSSLYETQYPNWLPWQWTWEAAGSSPAAIRILP